jgi:putative transposase
MNPETFVARVRSTIVDQNVAAYKELFQSTAPETAKDSHWRRALTLYTALSEPERAVLFEIMRQTTIDSVSNVLGILDGTSMIGESQEAFVLTTSDNQKINGNLQDLFLEAEENYRR